MVMEKKYFVNVKHVDNRLKVFLNGENVWDSGIVHGDPAMNEFIEITTALLRNREHTSELIFEGFNDDLTANGEHSDDFNPWHFHYRVIERSFDEHGTFIEECDLLEPYDQRHISKPNIRAMDNTYQIVASENGFKVINNTLTQQFAI
jgi:hypothetical protein